MTHSHNWAPNGDRKSAIERRRVHDHIVQYCDSEEFLCSAVRRFLAPGLEASTPAAVIASREHRDAFIVSLQRTGIDTDRAIGSGRFLLLDAETTLKLFMNGDLPDPARFKAELGNLIDKLRIGRETSPVLIYGEMVDILWRRGKGEAVARLEQLWNELSAIREFTLFWAYSMNGFYKEVHHLGLDDICNRHSMVLASEGVGGPSHELERMNGKKGIEQQASALQTEIQRRKEIEQALLRALADWRRAERELRDFVENAIEAISWVSPDGCILWANQAELDLLGYPRDEYVGHHINEFHADTGIVEDFLTRLHRNETLKNYETRLRCKDGTIRTVLINSNVMWEDGKFIHAFCFTRDITDRRRAEVAESYLSAIVESAEDAIVSKTLDGIVTSWNRGAEQLFGYTEQEMLHQPISRLIPPDHPDEEPQILAKLKRGERIEHYETQRIRKDGTIVHISLSVSPVRDSAGRIIGASKIARDITDRRRIDELERRVQERTAELKEANAELARSNAELEQFASVASHDLQEPLRTIANFTELLEKGYKHALDENAKIYITFIVDGAKRMQLLISDLLTYSRVGAKPTGFSQISMDVAVKNALQNLHKSISGSGARIAFDPLPVVFGDEMQLVALFQNLIGNAIKFRGREPLQIRICAEENDEGWQFSIRDNGIGIDLRNKEKIFVLFQRLHTREEYDGTGIGLALCKKIVERHGGRIWVESTPGEGSTFHFTIRKEATGRDESAGRRD
jgi:PAS domain S-box-containing protein